MNEVDQEHLRLESLQSLHILDSAPEPIFDALARAAAAACGTPIALVCLVDRDRQWFKANVGLEGVLETPREVSFCTHAIRGDKVFVVPDATRSAQFHDNVNVTGEPGIRAYAGAPIQLADGQRVGTLCVIDRIARAFDRRELEVLGELADAAAKALEMRAAALSENSARQQGLQRELALAQRLASVAQHSDDAIVTKSLDSVVTSWNLAAERMFGYGPSEMIGQPITRLFPPDRLHEEDYLLSRVLKGDTVPQFETVRVRKDGTEVHVSVSLSPIRDASGQIVAFSKVVRDNTQRRAEDELARHREGVASATEANGIGTWEIDLASGQWKWSDHMFALFDRDPATFGGTYEDWSQCVHPDDLPFAEAALRQAIEKCQSLAIDFRVVRRDSSDRRLCARATVIPDARGQAARVVGVNFDVTDRARSARRIAVPAASQLPGRSGRLSAARARAAD